MSRYVSPLLSGYLLMMAATQLIFDLAEKREEGHVGSKEGYSSGCLGCFSWCVSLLSIVQSCADWQLARCPLFSVLLVLERYFPSSR
jgi:hypothetical protein